MVKTGNKVDQRPAMSLYPGKVMHARMKPVSHRFSYAVTSILIDIDRLDEAARVSWLFSVNRANVVAFHEKHHGLRDGSSLRDHIDALMSEAGLTRPENVELLCYPSVLGFTFNPISVYFCRDAKGELTALIYQVHNTFGESHTYVEPVREGQASAAGIRQERDKQFYVSPFMDMAMRYRFRILPPGQTVALRILETDSVGPMLSASFHGRRSDATTAALLTAVLKTAGITWKVVAGIHWEALKLWIKGMKLRPRPAPPPLASFPDAPHALQNGPDGGRLAQGNCGGRNLR